ncbi:hypothetical protein OESDEN_01171 [Oesophagostomum dentatum]|uniref:Tc1-like transposase DDE domain-containing protein n=1 Tax=Oesophagostomum dentatum TaxID=61180 RepID=A0A0B1TTS6_OESDE|nr:hypothetical protein OESDEN_01171 [Oesophagostomum dentatum]
MGGIASFEEYVVDKFYQKNRVEVIRLPPHHCFLNPVELLWGNLKANITKIGKTAGSLHTVKEIPSVISQAPHKVFAGHGAA